MSSTTTISTFIALGALALFSVQGCAANDGESTEEPMQGTDAESGREDGDTADEGDESGDESGFASTTTGSDPDAPPTGGVPTDVTCEDQGEPRTIDCYYQQLVDAGITTVEDAIPFLPEDIRDGLFLMEASRSRHQATTEYPRVVLYGKDSDFIVSMSSLPSDPLYEVLEMIEFQDDGNFKFRQLDMSTDPPSLSADDVACQGCHGPRPRLIWGQYRTWPGNYEVDGEVQEQLRERAPERFGDLLGGWSVEIWNFQQNRLMMRHHAQFMKASGAYTPQMRYRIASSMCEGSSEDVTELMKQLGFSAVDTRGDLLAGEVQPDADLNWYGGGGRVSQVLQDVAVIDILYQDRDTELESILQPYIDALTPLYSLSQDYYDGYGGLLPFDLPADGPGNGASAPGPDGSYNGYGGNYGGLRLTGYLGAWTYEVPLFAGMYHEPIRAEFCSHVASKL